MKRKFSIPMILCAAIAVTTGSATTVRAADYRAVAAANGGTLADPMLQRDVMKSFHELAERYDRCATVDVPNKKVAYFKNGQWAEVWTMRDCGHERKIGLIFKKSPGGGYDFSVIGKP